MRKWAALTEKVPKPFIRILKTIIGRFHYEKSKTHKAWCLQHGVSKCHEVLVRSMLEETAYPATLSGSRMMDAWQGRKNEESKCEQAETTLKDKPIDRWSVHHDLPSRHPISCSHDAPARAPSDAFTIVVNTFPPGKRPEGCDLR